MNNNEFIEKINDAFYVYLNTGSRSNEKLKVLHGSIANDLKKRLGSGYGIHSLGYGSGHECGINGRYMVKMVDIGIEKNGEIIAGIALKFVMRNYSQNSNNYFENMLGETANIRANGKPYFQIFILPSQIPYFTNSGVLEKIENITENNLGKYRALSQDNIYEFMHTPNKTLFYLVDFPKIPSNVRDKDDYKKYYLKNNFLKIHASDKDITFDKNIVYNDYECFIDKVVHYIKSI